MAFSQPGGNVGRPGAPSASSCNPPASRPLLASGRIIISRTSSSALTSLDHSYYETIAGLAAARQAHGFGPRVAPSTSERVVKPLKSLRKDNAGVAQW